MPRIAIRSGRRHLLASSSIAALLIAAGTPAWAACAINQVGPAASVSNSSGSSINCINVQNSTVSGDVTNEVGGTITATGNTSPTTAGITINNSSIGGTVSNAGTITATSGVGIIVENNSTISGGVRNSGTISVSGDLGNSQSGAISPLDELSSGILVGDLANGAPVAISTFAGGISNSGTISSSGSLGNGVLVGGFGNTQTSVTISAFSGGVSNSGTITASGVLSGGILVGGGALSESPVIISTFSGGISNSGTISISQRDSSGIFVGGLENTQASVTISTFSGGITNSGTISISTSGSNGIVVGGFGISQAVAVTISAFSGGISNSGTITANGHGILVGGTEAQGIAEPLVTISTFSGGINNSGTILGGIFVNDVESFSGGINNSGSISGNNAIFVDDVKNFFGGINNSRTISAESDIAVLNVNTFSGGISNSGTIGGSDDGNGIFVGSVSLFSGGISNSGTISLDGQFNNGISIDDVKSFSGGISNSGMISAVTGIAIAGSTITGGIIDSGAIEATSHGITIDGQSQINATHTAISVIGPTFTGGITNAGTLSAANDGVFISGVTNFSGSISNDGTISAATGIAVSSSTINGAIVDSGTINAANHGIEIDSQSEINATGIAAIVVTGTTFTGGVSNAGTISGGANGILVQTANFLPSPANNFSGGISNSGSISASTGAAISVSSISAFSGGITNSGTLSAGGISTLFGFAIGTGIAVGLVSSFSGNIRNGGLITAADIGINLGNLGAFSGNIENTGTINSGEAGISVDGVSTFSGGVFNTGTISAATQGIGIGASTFTGGVSNGGAIMAGAADTGIAIAAATSFSGGVSNSGAISGGAGIALLFDSDFSGGISNSGTISASANGIFVELISAFSGNISNSGTISAANAIAIEGGVTFASGVAIINSGTLTGTTAAISLVNATSPVTIDQTGGLISGAIKLSANADVLNISGGTINGSIIGSGTSDTINFVPAAGNTFTYASSFGFSTVNQVNVDSGLVILDGTNSATNITVEGGTLEVGDAADLGATLTSTTPIDVFGTLAGHGTIIGGATIENGGTLAPGGSIGTLTIDGNLAFDPGGFYSVAVAPGQNSLTQVDGSVMLGGARVVASLSGFALGRHTGSTETILTTTNPLGARNQFNPAVAFRFEGTSAEQFDPLGAVVLAETSNSVLLTLPDFAVTLALPSNAPTNAQHVAGAINQFIVGGGTLPVGLQGLANLTGVALNNAANSLAGQTQGSFVPVGFDAGTMFLNLLLNPFVDGREAAGEFDSPSPGSGLAYAADEAKPAAYQALASALSPAAIGFAPHISLWASAYGGEGTIGGNVATGASSATSQIYGFAAGADDHIAPDTMFGLAIGGGGTNWQLNELGGGSSGLFQMGAYGTRLFGPAYVSGALAYSLQDVRNSRDAEVGTSDPLHGDFVANVLSGRIESGYHLPFGAITLTPYGAVQSQTMFLPSYGEVGAAGASSFALTYDGRTTTDTRTEVGAWFDTDLPSLFSGNVKLYGRAAFAHDFENEGSATALFQSLPGSGSFIIDSAKPDDNSALVTAGLEYKLGAGWSVLAKFDGEFSGNSTIVGGTGVLRKVW
ncbi:MAG: autotransporter domain-containing protein [Methylovirgula sp.]|uniref:autotransporter domain-containing protein n=1 Tax=Methylovirgula sp. TaxID=1978224 RepID=UPI0030765AEB